MKPIIKPKYTELTARAKWFNYQKYAGSGYELYFRKSSALGPIFVLDTQNQTIVAARLKTWDEVCKKFNVN